MSTTSVAERLEGIFKIQDRAFRDRDEALLGSVFAAQCSVLRAGPEVAGGTVAVQPISWLLVRDEITAPLSRGGLLVSTFAGGDGTITVHVFRDGGFARRTEPSYDPGFPGGWGVALEEERWCRFGDLDAPPGSMAQCLTLMTMLTGIRVSQAWLRDQPKRVVLVTPSAPTR